MTKVLVQGLTSYCRNFPEPPAIEVHREHLLDMMDENLSSEFQFLIIEGEDGTGKTSLMRQFALRHPFESISLFINPASQLGIDQGYLSLILGEQVHFALNQSRPDFDQVNEAFLRVLYPKLQKKARSNGKPIYFVIDGIDDISNNETQVQRVILNELLPLGLPEFRFVVSVKQSDTLNKLLHGAVRKKILQVIKFTPQEAEHLLFGLSLDSDTMNSFYQLSRGRPGYLQIIRRMLDKGIDPNSIIGEEPNKLPEFLEIEWCKSIPPNGMEEKIISIIAFRRNSTSIDDIASILNENTANLKTTIGRLGNLQCDSEFSKIDFVSLTDRRFAQNRIQHLREEVINLLISEHLKSPHNEATLMHLPEYYNQVRRYSDLLEFITPEHLSELLKNRHSIAPMLQRVELGLEASKSADDRQAMFRFSLEKSIILGLNEAEIGKPEIEAQLALEDYDTATKLALSKTLKEDRLQLLAVIVKKQRENGILPEEELVTQIRSLADQIDSAGLRERVVGIASDLIWVDPDLAISLIEKTGTNVAGDNSLDIAFAKLSINALFEKESKLFAPEAFKKATSKIKDPKTNQFLTAVSVFFENHSARQVIIAVDKLEMKNRLFFLRNWAMSHQKREDCIEVIEYALELIMKTTYVPSLRDLQEISIPLNHIEDTARMRKLVARIDSIKGTLEKTSTTVDKIKLELSLAHAEQRYNPQAARNRLIELFYFIADIHDLSVKTECLAWLKVMLMGIDPNEDYEVSEGIHSLTETELVTNIKLLLSNAAEQYDASIGAMRALCKSRPMIAYDIAMSLNTQDRRDLALLEISNELNSEISKMEDFGVLLKVIESICDRSLKDIAFTGFFESLLSHFKKFGDVLLNVMRTALSNVNTMTDAFQRCQCFCYAINLFMNQTEKDMLKEEISTLLKMLDEDWLSIDVIWLKIDLAYTIATILGNSQPATASLFVKRAYELRQNYLFESKNLASTYIYCLRLAIRALSGFIMSKIPVQEEIKRLENLIDKLPSKGERALLWSHLAFYGLVNDDKRLCNELVMTRIIPLFEDISEKDKAYKSSILIEIAPTLYFGHPMTALKLLKNHLTKEQEDGALSEIVYALFRKTLSSDPYEDFYGKSYQLNKPDVEDIISLLEKMCADTLIYDGIERLANSLTARNQKSFSRQQLADISSRLKVIINDRLPDKRNITHDGYKIAALAHVYRIERINDEKKWRNLVDQCNSIPNIADRALVKSWLSVIVPNGFAKLKSSLYDEAKKTIESISAVSDKVDRYHQLAECTQSVDFGDPKPLLKIAMSESVSNEEFLGSKIKQKEILDLAHRIDPSFAATLSALADDDPARANVKYQLAKHLKILVLADKLANLSLTKNDLVGSNKELSEAAWKSLGQLNAGYIQPVHLDQIIDFLKSGAIQSCIKSYPIYAFIIENLVRRSNSEQYGFANIVPIYNEILTCIELAGSLAGFSALELNKMRKAKGIASIKSSVTIIKPGERSEAFTIIKDWVSNLSKNEIIISDPYFGVEELDFLSLLNSVNKDFRVSILTSRNKQMSYPQPWDEHYRKHWRLKISAQKPPSTEIVIIGTEGAGLSPLHDRWILSEQGGLDIGTSLNSLGITKTSSIKKLGEVESVQLIQETKEYVMRQKKEYNGEPLLYHLFNL